MSTPHYHLVVPALLIGLAASFELMEINDVNDELTDFAHSHHDGYFQHGHGLDHDLDDMDPHADPDRGGGSDHYPVVYPYDSGPHRGDVAGGAKGLGAFGGYHGHGGYPAYRERTGEIYGGEGGNVPYEHRYPYEEHHQHGYADHGGYIHEPVGYGQGFDGHGHGLEGHGDIGHIIGAHGYGHEGFRHPHHHSGDVFEGDLDFAGGRPHDYYEPGFGTSAGRNLGVGLTGNRPGPDEHDHRISDFSEGENVNPDMLGPHPYSTQYGGNPNPLHQEEHEEAGDLGKHPHAHKHGHHHAHNPYKRYPHHGQGDLETHLHDDF